jgi:hypothetical protein
VPHCYPFYDELCVCVRGWQIFALWKCINSSASFIWACSWPLLCICMLVNHSWSISASLLSFLRWVVCLCPGVANFALWKCINSSASFIWACSWPLLCISMLVNHSWSISASLLSFCWWVMCLVFGNDIFYTLKVHWFVCFFYLGMLMASTMYIYAN